MQFSQKKLQNNRLTHLLWELVPPPPPPEENPGSATDYEAFAVSKRAVGMGLKYFLIYLCFRWRLRAGWVGCLQRQRAVAVQPEHVRHSRGRHTAVQSVNIVHPTGCAKQFRIQGSGTGNFEPSKMF